MIETLAVLALFVVLCAINLATAPCRHSWVQPRRRDDGGIALVCATCRTIVIAQGRPDLLGQKAEP